MEESDRVKSGTALVEALRLGKSSLSTHSIGMGTSVCPPPNLQC